MHLAKIRNLRQDGSRSALDGGLPFQSSSVRYAALGWWLVHEVHSHNMLYPGDELTYTTA